MVKCREKIDLIIDNTYRSVRALIPLPSDMHYEDD
jgi:hypothetical protein